MTILENINRLDEISQIILNDNEYNSYLPQNLIDEENKTLELLRKRLNLEDTISKTLEMSKSVNWKSPNQNIDIVRTPKDVIDVFKLRSDVYTPMGYNEEFSEEIEGLNYDEYDKTSVILTYKRNKKLTGSIRIIFDNNKLQSENEIDLFKIRKKGNIAEFSRQVVSPKFQGSGIEFKNFYTQSYNIAKNNNIQIYLAAFAKKDLKLYQKFGGIEVIKGLNSYGNIENNSLIATWDIRKISTFFEKIFLSKIEN